MQEKEIHFVKVAKIAKAEAQPVYNLQTKEHHNFLVSGGVVVHNCDSLRYYCAARTQREEKPIEPTPYEAQIVEEIQSFTSGQLYDVYGGSNGLYD